jgi:D-aminopeptidase
MERMRAQHYGLRFGRLPRGERNAITDVSGVRVGQVTVSREDTAEAKEAKEAEAVRTGVTVIWPHAGAPWRERVYAGTSILNGYGELIGINQIDEWGLLHSPIVITSSLAIGRAYDATARWIADHDPSQGTDDVFMPVVTECDDSFLNDARSFPLSDQHVFEALESAGVGQVAEGCVGAGTGMQCFDFKGGIGTASRALPAEQGGFTVGALVCTNFGARPDLLIQGVPVGREIPDLMPEARGEGSCVVVLATDAPMLPHQLRRLALRGGLGLARCGSIGANGSGELLIAFSTAQVVPRQSEDSTLQVRALLDGAFWHLPSVFDPLFAAAVETVEEAVANALFTATTTRGRAGHVLYELPIDQVLEILDRYGRLEASGR